MSNKETQEIYRPYGLVIPMITPLAEGRDKLEVDIDDVNELITKHFDGWADAIFIAGGCGEMYTIPYAQRIDLIAASVDAAKGRMRSLVGVSARYLDEVKAFSQAAELFGADGVVINLLYGEGSPKEKLKTVERSTTLPITIYDIPDRQYGRALDPVIYGPYLKPIEQVVGIKSTTRNVDVIDPWLDIQEDDFRVLPGSTQTLKHAINRGSRAWVMGLANVFPEAFATDVLLDQQGNCREASLEGVQVLWAALKAEPEPLKNYMFQRELIKSSLIFPPR